jgi:SET domain-containing protein
VSTRPFTPSRNISARPSSGKGRGVFATRRIRAGEIIETAPVLLVPKEQAALLATSFLGHYMFKSDNKKHFVIGLGFSSLINHGADANAEFFVSIDCIVVKARRAILSGAEVTIDYGWRAEEWALVGVAFPPA